MAGAGQTLPDNGKYQVTATSIEVIAKLSILVIPATILSGNLVLTA
jgi:hypothetical protein